MEGKSIDDEIREYIKSNASVVYKQESREIGLRNDEGGKEKKRTLDGKFTKVNIIYNIKQHLASSGMYRFNGLNTVLDKERFAEGSKDWMLKLV